jgi:osmoprotectant transport system substrate-binding protein
MRRPSSPTPARRPEAASACGRHPFRVLVALLAALSLLGAACGDDDDTESGDSGQSDGGGAPPEGPAISIGAQDFGESAILAEVYRQALDDQGFDVSIQTVGGFRDLLFGAFDSGDVNLAPDYVASELEFLNENAGEATGDVDETFDLLLPRLEDRGLTGLDPSAAVDTNAFVVTQETADANGLETLSDLAENGADLKLGAPQDCETNPFCIPGLQDVYGLDMSGNFTPLDPGVVLTSLQEGAIDVGLLFSTDGRIASEGLVLLEDDQHMLAADNVFPVLSQELVDAYGDDLTSVLDGISGELTTDDLTELNKRYDVDKEDADAIAEDWLSEHDITSS